MGRKIQERVYLAASRGRLENLRNLLDHKCRHCVKRIFSSQNLEHGGTPLIAACTFGFVDIVEYFIKKFNIDIEFKGSGCFNGIWIKGVTPLWSAAKAGHLEVVKKLISYGALVNATIKVGSTYPPTPLLTACCHANYKIAEYLIKKGADVEVTDNETGSTCLIKACGEGQIDLVKCLIQYGANINRKSGLFGHTALDLSLFYERCDIIQVLLNHGAEMGVNPYGMTVLQNAAIGGKVSVVECILKNRSCTLIEKVDAYKLLGAMFVDEKHDMISGLKFWEKAVAILNQDVSSPILEPLDISPILAYNNVTEVNTFEQFQALKRNLRDIEFQVLVIRERIFGVQHPYTKLSIERCSMKYYNEGNLDRFTKLQMHIFSIQNDKSVLQLCVNYFGDILCSLFDASNPIPDSYVCSMLIVLHETIEEIRKLPAHNAENCDSYVLLQMAIVLASCICQFLPCLPCNEKQQFIQEVQELVLINPINFNGCTVLHLACSVIDFDFCNIPACIIPSLEFVELLLKCGASPNVRNDEGATVLHTVARLNRVHTSLFKLLLQYGAHLDYRDSCRKTALDYCPTFSAYINPLNYLNLKCLCAQTIRKAEMPFHGRIPETLAKFLDRH